ncbi:acyltransferase family protein [Sphingomonas rosea]|uniref:Acyltransferase family protein n=1 Tax=Sphingomonas rosea TaxID=335605 RepID=A0ABP7U1V7_9SPHN
MKLLVPSTAKYRADIDGLRSVAVLAVLVFHAFPERLPGGFVGVDVFFVISGYLITAILLRSEASGLALLGEFYRRRIRRIFPALLVVLLACIAAGFLTLLAADFARLGKHVAGGAGFVANLVFWSEASYFDTQAITKPLLHLWSLGVEEQFYFLWPLVIIAARRTRHGIGAALAVIFLLSLGYCVAIAPTDPTAAFYSPLTRFWELLAGAGLVHLERQGFRLNAVAAHAASMAGLVLIAAALLLIDERTLFPGWWALLPVGGATLVIAAGPLAVGNRYLLSLQPAVWIGLISYPLYLWHWPLLSFGYLANYQEVLPGPVRAGLLLLSVFLAWATWRFVERPPALRRHYTPLKLLAAMGLVFAAGLAVFHAGGLPSRSAARDPRRLFVARYQDMHLHGIARAYRSECDFAEWGTLKARSAIAPSCWKREPGPYVLLWGDSHAQSLSLGLSGLLGEVPLHQVATSGCRPDLEIGSQPSSNPALAQSCAASNRFAARLIAAEKPDLLIIAQADDHLARDWPALARRLKALGVKRILLVGPLPQWKPSLPLVIAAHHWPYRGERIADGLDGHILDADRALRAQRRRWTALEYVSVIDRLCNASGCIAHVPGRPTEDILTLDYGHLTPMGSRYVAETALRPALRGTTN